MVDQQKRLKYRKKIRIRKRKVQSAGKSAEETVNKHFFKRLSRGAPVRRFVFAWVLLLVLMGGGLLIQNRALTNLYQDETPAAGGTYTEGQVGSYTNSNPMYAVGDVDKTVSRLVYSGLLKYDQDNDLVGDVAKSYSVDDRAVKYTVSLRDDVYWHDGVQLTSEDVAYTYKTIQLADAKSPLRPIWQKVKIETKGPYTVTFTLPHSLSSFPHSLTTGIVPEHLLGSIPPSRLRSVQFNTTGAVGSGPFKLRAVEVEGNNPEDRQERIGLSRNTGYFEGAPMIDRFIVRAYYDDDKLKESFKSGELTALSGLSNIDESVQEESEKEYDIPLMAQVLTFFNNSNGLLANDKIRQGLIHATDTDKLTQSLGYALIQSDSILLKKHLGYNEKIVQRDMDINRANKLLDSSGWSKRNTEGFRVNKKGVVLELTLYSKDIHDYRIIASALQEQWRRVGVKLDVKLQNTEDLESTVAFHNYDILLYGISVGNDPDVYAYWHSSQADTVSSSGLNFSEYKSDTVDQALEGGRSRTDSKIRAAKYQPMLTSFRDDAPAIALYQPRLLYLTSRDVYNFNPGIITTPSDRFSNVHRWSIRQVRVDKL